MIEQTWALVEHELEEQFEGVFHSLNGPATAEELQQLEATCGLALPAEFKQSLMRHNGQRTQPFPPGIWNGARLLPVAEITKTWKLWAELQADPIHGVHPSNDTSKEIRSDVCWHPGWIPFSEDDMGNCFVVDLAPRPKGTVGQVFQHLRVEVSEVIAPSYAGWLDKLAQRLRKRTYMSDTADLGGPWFDQGIA